MSLSSSTQCDPARLAAEVRDLAFEAYRTLHDPFPSTPEAVQLSRRIARLQGKLRSLPAPDLSLWLENLRQRVESATPPLREPSVVGASHEIRAS
jgi:hypothetical protein